MKFEPRLSIFIKHNFYRLYNKSSDVAQFFGTFASLVKRNLLRILRQNTGYSAAYYGYDVTTSDITQALFTSETTKTEFSSLDRMIHFKNL